MEVGFLSFKIETVKTDEIVEIFGADQEAVRAKMISLCSKLFITPEHNKSDTLQDEVVRSYNFLKNRQK
jgi:hypothetical protein